MTERVPFAVVAAHRVGQPLNHELTAIGGRVLGVRRTAAVYRMLALDGPGPARGGIIRVPTDGAGVEIELHALPVHLLGRLVTGLPDPLAVGRVLLDDGSAVTGLVCAWRPRTASDVTEYGSWPRYLGSLTVGVGGTASDGPSGGTQSATAASAAPSAS